MPARLAAGVGVSALLRRIAMEGGSGAVLAKGDATAGALLLLLAVRGEPSELIERSPGLDGDVWRAVGPEDAVERDAYLERRRRSDPDLWIVELDHPAARAIALETMG